ncbi:MAG: hypothetical protein HC929_12305 [Leptolyngbyaceae cyanobacterium SM2_5_2]|nr:hypothetical protein [Leptolyngbyaceae cyanobacterium SM2_5_2]
MASKRPPSKIYPRVSTLPRQQTEAAHYLDMYKLTVEKQRIHQELESLEQRRQRLYTRLAEIDHQAEGLGQLASTQRHQDGQRYRPNATRPAPTAMPTAKVYLPDRQSAGALSDYSTVLLEY